MKLSLFEHIQVSSMLLRQATPSRIMVSKSSFIELILSFHTKMHLHPFLYKTNAIRLCSSERKNERIEVNIVMITRTCYQSESL